MADKISKERRSWNMSRIRGKDTKPELRLRSLLHKSGYRYRTHSAKLPGKPDLAFMAARVAVFVDGCFWHHCPIHYTRPGTNTAFWDEKIAGNVERDQRTNKKLQDRGWTVLRFWEHEIDEDITCVARSIRDSLETTYQSNN